MAPDKLDTTLVDSRRVNGTGLSAPGMEVRVDSLLEGASRAEGTAVIVDVYRAFTTAAVAFSRGAERIILVPDIEDALALRESGAGELCIGEVGGVKPDGFDFGNSPHELSRADVKGRTLVQSTRAGTVGVSLARGADRVYAGSLAVASATAAAVLRRRPPLVTVVAMGLGGPDAHRRGRAVRHVHQEPARGPQARPGRSRRPGARRGALAEVRRPRPAPTSTRRTATSPSTSTP